jgi:hypothetical protein
MRQERTSVRCPEADTAALRRLWASREDDFVKLTVIARDALVVPHQQPRPAFKRLRAGRKINRSRRPAATFEVAKRINRIG